MGLFRKLFEKEQDKIVEEDNKSISSQKDNLIGKIDVCPYCNKKLENIPSKKKKCEFCGKFIYVRTKQNIFSSAFLKEDEAIAVDWFKKIEAFGITKKDFLKQQEELTKRFKSKAKPTDVIWGLFNQQLFKENELHSRKMIYFEMARFIYEEGKNPCDLLKEAAKCDLLKYKLSRVVSKVKISSCDDLSCNECRNLNGKIYSIEEALSKMPLPCENCKHDKNKNGFSWCRCRWVGEL